MRKILAVALLVLFSLPVRADVDSIARGMAAKAKSASAYVIDPVQAGGGTADGSAYINSMLAEHGSIYIPNCATVIMANSAAMPDGSSIDGGGCATLKMSASMASNTTMISAIPGAAPGLRTLIANATPSAGNSKIVVKNITLDGTLSPGNGHLAFFYKTSNVVFENNTCVGPGGGNIQDCVAFPKSDNYRVVKNYCYGVGNACYDQWEGAHDFVIMGNYGDGAGVNSYCILVNGVSTAFTADTTYNGTITGNVCKNHTQVGIWVGGLYQSSNGVVGDVRNVSVTGNTIDTVTSVHGIYVSDASDIAIANNIVRAAGSSCIRIGSQKPSGGTTDNITVASNVFDACNSAGVGANAIYITTNASHVTVSNNSIVGSAQAYSAYADNTTTNVFLQGVFPAGATGGVFNQSTPKIENYYDAFSTNFRMTSPGNVNFGINGAQNQISIDTGANISPFADLSRRLGSSAFRWQWVKSQWLDTVKITQSNTAPGAGYFRLEAVAGTNAGTCKLIAYAGTSTTPTTIIDNVGGGC